MISFLQGDVTKPQLKEGEHCIIAHIVNDQNKFGSGIAAFMAKRYPFVKKEYHAWANRGYCYNEEYDIYSPFQLGYNQYVDVFYGDESITVCNMLAQKGMISAKNPHPMQPISLIGCLECLDQFCDDWNSCFQSKAAIHMGKIGSLRGGGNWEQTLDKIKMILPTRTVYIYEFDENESPKS